ncbi:MAG: hypothetical protein ACI82I_003397 [Gammaproteobacteria bacterium]|jgi:hypothetical protein
MGIDLCPKTKIPILQPVAIAILFEDQKSG